VENLETTIRRHLVRYLAGQMSIDAFTDWLVGATWNIQNSGDAGASRLAYSVEHVLAEASDGLLTLDELRAELRGLTQHVNLNLTSQGRVEKPRNVQVRHESSVATINWRNLRNLLPRTLSPAGTLSQAVSW
jgi:hypothetical protein